jgi:hypothetical protein
MTAERERVSDLGERASVQNPSKAEAPCVRSTDRKPM